MRVVYILSAVLFSTMALADNPSFHHHHDSKHTKISGHLRFSKKDHDQSLQQNLGDLLRVGNKNLYHNENPEFKKMARSFHLKSGVTSPPSPQKHHDIEIPISFHF